MVVRRFVGDVRDFVPLVERISKRREVEFLLIGGLCSFGTQRLILWISDAPTEIVDGGFEDHFTEFKPPTPRTHGSAERALDA